MKFTVFGSKGFIGSNLVSFLELNGYEVFKPERGYIPNKNEDLGNVIYAIGLTADFRTRIFDTVEAHVSYLAKILQQIKFQSFVYLSSTRVYLNSDNTSEESSLKVNPNHFDDLYNLSKLMGEAICLAKVKDISDKKSIKIVRISNVVGDDPGSENFIFSLIRDAKKHKKITLMTAMNSEKDYISIEDVTRLISRISLDGHSGIYNVASGSNLTHQEIINSILKHFPAEVIVKEDAKPVIIKHIDNEKIRREFNFSPTENMINRLIEKSLQSGIF